MNDHTKTDKSSLEPTDGGARVHAMDGLARTAHQGIDAASQAAHPVIDRVATGAHNALENADELANQASLAIDKAGVKTEEAINASTSYMRDHPLLTLALAVGAGYALSRLLTAR